MQLNLRQDFFVLIILASMIASLGLLQNSAAVIIGAMLVCTIDESYSGHGNEFGFGQYSSILLKQRRRQSKGLQLRF